MNSQSAGSLTYKLLWRDWKGGELNILVFSLVLAVATVTCISLFTSRIHNSIYEEASTFLAADAKITGSLPAKPAWEKHIDSLGLSTAKVTRFRAMAFSENDMILTQVKAVSDSYPLKGNVFVSDQPFSEGLAKNRGPKKGKAWLANRLFDALNIQIGETITIGDAEFVVSAAITKEPDSGQSFFGVAPRIMIHSNDVSRTNAIQPGSRIEHDLLLSGAEKDIRAMKDWLTPRLGVHHRWIGVKNANISIDVALIRAERFLLLTGCLSVILAGVAIALAAQRYAKRHHQHVALLKTLGAGPKKITRMYLLNIFAIGVTGVSLGAILGWGFQWGIIYALGDLIPVKLAPASILAYSTGAITGFVTMWAFVAPPILALRQVFPGAILREHNQKPVAAKISIFLGLFAIFFLMLLYSRDVMITITVSLGITVCIIGVWLASLMMIELSRFAGRSLKREWKMGFTNLKRHRRYNSLQIIIFSLIFLLFFILINIRSNLLTQWQNQLPDEAPNHFMFNIFPEEKNALNDFFDDHSIKANPFFPMTRGRVLAVNGTTIENIQKKKNNRTNYERELNLTWSLQLNADNSVIEGQWWNKNLENSSNLPLLVSAESRYASGLNLSVGDKISYSVAGQEIEATVASIRSVKWDSMNPNFYMIFNQPLLGGVSANWITSFYLNPDEKPLLNTLSRNFPTTSIIEIDQTIAQVQSIVKKVSLAIEFILALVLVSGVLVLITSIQSTLDSRIKESAIYRTLGAPKIFVQKTLAVEFVTLGIVSGLLAVLGTELSLYLLQTQIFSLDYFHQGWLWLWGPLLSGALIGLTGAISTRHVVHTPPISLLREIS